MPWNFLTRLARRFVKADATAAMRRLERENDVFAELIAASSFLDSVGATTESKLKDIDLDRRLRPW